MKGLLQSRGVAWLAMAVMVGVILFTFSIRPAWWAFIDEFFAFMAVFCQLVAVYSLPKMPFVAKKLQVIAAWCLGLAVIAFIIEYIFWQL